MIESELSSRQSTEDFQNFYNVSLSSFDISSAYKYEYSNALSDVTMEYDFSQNKYDFTTDSQLTYDNSQLTYDNSQQVGLRRSSRIKVLKDRYLKNNVLDILSGQREFKNRTKSFEKWEKASNEVVLSKLKNIQRLIRRGYCPIEIFTENSRYISFRSGKGHIYPVKKERNHMAEFRREQYLTFLDMLIEAQTKNNWLILRDVYYRSTKVFRSARNVNEITDDICRTTNLNRLDLNIFTVANGSVYGNLTFKYENNLINCMNSIGITIPGKQHLVHSFKSNAKFILIVEKFTVFHHLIENKVIDELGPVIIITGNGQPDFSARIFCHNLSYTLNIPVLALVDCNYFGFQIMTVYKYGSLKMQCENKDLVVPDLFWIGLWPSDCKERNLIGKAMTEIDRSRIYKMLERPFINEHPRWKQELEILLKIDQKIEIQSLFDYNCESSPVILYIREKLMMYELI